MMITDYDYQLSSKFGTKIDLIYEKYKYSNNHQFYEDLGEIIHSFPIHVLTDFDNTFAISTEYKLFRLNIMNIFRNSSFFVGLKNLFNLINIYIKYRLGKRNLDVILQTLFVNDMPNDLLENLITNTSFKKQGFDLLLKLKKQKKIDVMNIVVLSRNSVDLVRRWIEQNKLILRQHGLQIVGVLGNKLVYLEESKKTVVLNPIIDTHTKVKIFPNSNFRGEKIIWMSDKDEQSETKKSSKVESYFV